MRTILFIIALLLMAFIIHCDRDENNGTGPLYDRKDVYLNVSVKDSEGEGIPFAGVQMHCYSSNEDIMTIWGFFTNMQGYGNFNLKIIAKEDGNDTVLVIARKEGYEKSDSVTVLPLQDGHTETLNFVLNPLE